MSFSLVEWMEGETLERQVIPTCWIDGNDMYWPEREALALSYQKSCQKPKLNGKWDTYPIKAIVLQGDFPSLNQVLTEMSAMEESDVGKECDKKSDIPSPAGTAVQLPTPPPKFTNSLGKRKYSLINDSPDNSPIAIPLNSSGGKRPVSPAISVMQFASSKKKKVSTPIRSSKSTDFEINTPLLDEIDETEQSHYSLRDLPNSPHRSPNKLSKNSDAKKRSRTEIRVPDAIRMLGNRNELPMWKFQKLCLELLVEIRDLNRRRVTYDEEDEFMLITSHEEYEELERKLAAKEDVTLIPHLRKIGGSDSGECARNMLDRTFSLEFLTSMNMQGRATVQNDGTVISKIAFAKSQIYKRIIGIVTKKFKSNENSVKKAVETKLRNAPKQLAKKRE